MKSTILLFISLCFTVMLQAQVSKTIQVTAGNLYYSLTAEELATVTSLTLTGTIKALDFRTFSIMPSLTELDLSEVKIVRDDGRVEINVIPSNAFNRNAAYPNDHLKSIKLPLMCEIISGYAFSGCTGLTSLIIPRSVVEIGDSTFSGCSLKSVTFLSNFTFQSYVPSRQRVFFDQSYKDVELPYLEPTEYNVSLGAIKELSSTIGVTTDSAWTVSSNRSWLTVNPASGRGEQMITVTADVNHLETCRTAQLTFKIDTVIVNSVVVSQSGATKQMNVSAGDFSYLLYEETQLLNSIRLTGTIDKSDMDVMSRMPWLSEIDMREVDILAYDAGYYVYPENTIPDNEFGNRYIEGPVYNLYRKLKSILLPYSCTSIGNHAFENCAGLTSVIIPSSVTSIGDGAFFRCTGFTSITIPSSVTTIGYGAFSGCTGLTSIFAHLNSPDHFRRDIWGEITYYEVDKFKCTLFVPYGLKQKYATDDGWRDFINIVEIPFVEVFKTQLNLAASAGSTATTKIVSDLSWKASSDQTWLTLSKNTGIGEDKLTFTADANPTASPRTAIVTVSAVGVETQTITITQEGGPTALPDLVENSTKLNCYPNPFNSVATICWQMEKTSRVTLKVLDIVGRTVATLVDEQRPQGKYETQFNAGTLPKGIYFSQLKAGEFMQTRKMILVE